MEIGRLPELREITESLGRPRQLGFTGNDTEVERAMRILEICRGYPSSVRLSTDQCMNVRKLPVARERLNRGTVFTQTENLTTSCGNGSSRQKGLASILATSPTQNSAQNSA